MEDDLPAWQLVLPPGARFTHLTAASRYGLWLPPIPDGLPVFVAMGEEGTRPQRAGLQVTRHRELAAVRDVDGLRLDPPPEMLLACARHLGLVDLVVLVDAALHQGMSTRAELRQVAAQRRRGAPCLRRALDLADGRAESPWETLLRLLHVMSGVPVVPQHVLVDENGSFVARVDLWVEGTNAAHEYDGQHHLDRKQQRKDLSRARAIGNLAWVRRGYTSGEVINQAVTIIRDADLSLGREHRPARVRAWHRALEDSLFTPSGTHRFLARLNLSRPRLGAPVARWSA